MHRPDQPGIYSPCAFVGQRDGDTVVVRLPTLGEVAIRLAGIDTPETDAKDPAIRAAGEKSKAFTRDTLVKADAGDLVCWLMLPQLKKGEVHLDTIDWLKHFTFDRVPGTLFIGSYDLRVLLLARGLAKRVAKFGPCGLPPE